MPSQNFAFSRTRRSMVYAPLESPCLGMQETTPATRDIRISLLCALKNLVIGIALLARRWKIASLAPRKDKEQLSYLAAAKPALSDAKELNGLAAAKRNLAGWPSPPELFQLHFFGGCAGCFSTYCLMNSIKTSVIFLPSAAVAALKASCRLASTFRFMRFHRGSCRRFTLLRAHKIAFFIRVYSQLTLICAYQHSSVQMFCFL